MYTAGWKQSDSSWFTRTLLTMYSKALRTQHSVKYFYLHFAHDLLKYTMLHVKGLYLVDIRPLMSLLDITIRPKALHVNTILFTLIHSCILF
jgi:hypothetical protein